jgi:hypothetical protein
MHLRYQPGHAQHILPVAIAKEQEEAPLFDKRAKEKVQIGQNGECEAVGRDMGVAGKDDDAGEVQGVAHNPVHAGGDKFFVSHSLDISRDLAAREISPDLLETHELPGIEMFERKRAEGESCRLDDAQAPAKDRRGGPYLLVGNPLYQEHRDNRGNDADSNVEGAVPDTHKRIAEQALASEFKPPGGRDAVDEREERKNENDYSHELTCRSYAPASMVAAAC